MQMGPPGREKTGAAAKRAGVLPRIRTLTFDCYGTLIDWRAGLTQSFVRMFGPAVRPRLGELFDGYIAIEAEVEAEPYRPYREVLATVARRMAGRLGLDLPDGRESVLAESLPSWPAFSDTGDALRRLKTQFRLGVLSNVDRDLFEATAGQFPIEFDFVVTAEDVRSYKPRPAHFHRCLEEYGDVDSTLHVAQSLFHDGAAAGALGIAYVWINRYADRNDTAVRPAAEFGDLRSLAEALS